MKTSCRLVLLLMTAVLPCLGTMPAVAQTADPPRPSNRRAPTRRPTVVPAPVAPAVTPPAPAPAPPPPVQLAPTVLAPPPPPPEPPLVLPASMSALPTGAWRLRYAAEAVEPPGDAAAALAELGRRLGRRPSGRFTLFAQVSGPANDVSAARRLSLARGLALKQALVAGGLGTTRIDLRAMGRTAEALDAVDVIPPEAQRAETAAAEPSRPPAR